VSPRFDPATKDLTKPGFNQVFLDPVSGAELGKREWGAVWPITQETFVSFLYRLHYTLHIPRTVGHRPLGPVADGRHRDDLGGRQLRRLLPDPAGAAQGSAACEIAEKKAAGGKSWWQRWQPAWKVRWSGGSVKLNFDLHRAFSLWTWILLFILAFTAFSLNLYTEVFYPVMRKVSTVTPTPFDTRPMADKLHLIEPKVPFADIVQRAAPRAGAATGMRRPAACSIRRNSASTWSACTSRATTMAAAASVRRCCTTMASTAGCWATASRGRAPRPISSCRPSSRCIRDASSACPGVY
jgi:uncharacterized iron-regulated membrane protein